ncbi:hypothetical protein EHW66_04275 [Erwinia psidii]|uniref:Uncharacterized protein n=1 Tax=Erwinia psidii TaxID=69224 RepID=A0A3N6RX19_9GAMM|nr:hypothetical protein [Erwinia psidii]MCX8964259.1 hypothetical protein [Erwinia psidii]RQM36907.1 hypothetical protein EB241_18280 [Erwinia psidii]
MSHTGAGVRDIARALRVAINPVNHILKKRSRRTVSCNAIRITGVLKLMNYSAGGSKDRLPFCGSSLSLTICFVF